jgi:hypothetical protein
VVNYVIMQNKVDYKILQHCPEVGLAIFHCMIARLTRKGVSFISFPRLILSSQIQRGGESKTQSTHQRGMSTPCMGDNKYLGEVAKAVVIDSGGLQVCSGGSSS